MTKSFFYKSFIVSSFFISSFCYADFMSVSVNQAILHDAPSDSSSKTFIVTKGYPLEVVVSLREWKKVKDHTGTISWINSENLSQKKMVLNQKKENPIYLEADSGSPILAKVNENVPLEILELVETGKWIKVYSSVSNIEGYIYNSDLWGVK